MNSAANSFYGKEATENKTSTTTEFPFLPGSITTAKHTIDDSGGLTATDYIHIGDYVTLQLSKPNEGWLCSEGLLGEDCFFTENTSNFDDCLWEVTVQYQYSAQREYNEALQQQMGQAEQSANVEDEQRLSVKTSRTKAAKATKSAETLLQLQKAALNEQRLNEKLMSIKMGKPVAFGDPIQLRQVKSRKFLTVDSGSLAKEERENMRVSVETVGNSLSCLGFMPRYKYDKEGQLMTNGSEAFIRVHERPGEFIHAAKRYINGVTDADENSEINCSLESTSWTISIYQRAADMTGKSIFAGQLISFQDPDNLSCLTVETHIPGATERAKVIMSPQFQVTREWFTSETEVGTNLLWLIEKHVITVGGPIGIRSDSVTLRNLNSGLYMKHEKDGLYAVKNKKDASLFEFHNSQVSAGNESNTLMEEAAVHMSVGNQWVGNNADTTKDSFKQSALNCVIKNDKSDSMSLLVSAALFKKIGSNLHIGVYATINLRRFERVSKQFANGEDCIRDVARGIKLLLPSLENLCSFLALADEESKDELLELPTKETIICRQNMMREQGLLDVLLDILVLTKTDIYDRIVLSVLKRDMRRTFKHQESTAKLDEGTSIKRRNSGPEEPAAAPKQVQPMMRRRGSFQLLPGLADRLVGLTKDGNNTKESDDHFDPMKALLTKNNTATNTAANKKNTMLLNRAPGGGAGSTGSGDISKQFVRKVSSTHMEEDEEDLDNGKDDGFESPEHQTLSHQVAHKCLKVLFYAIQGNHTNQLYIADRLPVLLSQVKKQKLASLCVQEMLRDNLTILQTKVRQRDIDIIVQLLAETEMGVTYLKLLQSTCSCPRGVDATQRMVAIALFGQSNSTPRHSEISIAGAEGERESAKRQTFSMKFKRAVGKAIVMKQAANALALTTEENLQSRPSLAQQQLVLKIHADRVMLRPSEWSENPIYSPADMNFAQILGYNLVEQGAPELRVSWKISGEHGDYSMLQLYGYEHSVPLTVICQVLNKDAKVKKSFVSNVPNTSSPPLLRRKATMYKKKQSRTNPNQTVVTIVQFKMQVAEYLITQLYLVADLCLDRNYVAINLLESLYEYDVLITILKNTSISNRFKAPVCRILRCLWVDREPQVATKFPRYIRTSVSLGGEMSEEQHTEANSYKFALIQRILSEYITGSLNATNCDELSAEMMDLLQALVEFGFYVTPEQIHDILGPLISVLDNHRKPRVVELEEESGSLEVEDKSTWRKVRKWFNRCWSSLLTRRNGSGGTVLPTHDDFDDDHPEKGTMVKSKGGKGKDGDESNKEGEVVKKQWEKRYLEFMESIYGLIIVLSVVLASVVIAIMVIVAPWTFSEFIIASTAFFAVEIFLRIYCYYRVKKTVLNFFRDPYNSLDFLLVLLDFVLLGIGYNANYANAGRAARTFRLFRLLRIIRIVRAARVLKKITETTQNEFVWKSPARFAAISVHEASTVTSIIKALAMFYDRIQDKHLDLTIKAFVIWFKETKGKKSKRTAVEIYNKVILSEETMSNEITDKFDIVLLDIMMYNDASLVQEAFNLLMVHKSQQELFVHTTDNIQIVYSPRVEKICQELTYLLRDLKRLAEMYEIWSNMLTDEDKASSNRVVEILRKILGHTVKTNEDRTLCIKSKVLVDEEVQNLLRNLDAMATFMSLMESLFDGGREVLTDEVTEIMRLTNEVICAFVQTSEANQAVAFKYIEWFADRVDNQINSSSVLRAILEGNKDLIKQCPRQLISDFSQKILSNGRRPEYLDMYVGMTEFSELMDCRVLAVENEISGFLTSREWKKHVLLWCCGPDSTAYMERKATMMKLSEDPEVPVTDEMLTPDLKYHVRLLALFAGCNLGPKLQAIYSLADVIHGILDPATIFPVRHALGKVLVEMLKSAMERVEKSELFWKFLYDVLKTFQDLEKNISNLTAVKSSLTLRIQTGEWLEICISIVISFFGYFDLNTYDESSQFDKAKKTFIIDPKQLIRDLQVSLKALLETHSQRLGKALTEEIQVAVMILNKLEDNAIDDGIEIDDKLKMIRAEHKRTSIVYADIQQAQYRKQFKMFMIEINGAAKQTAKQDVIDLFEKIPSVHDRLAVSDVRFEPLLKKLTAHLRSMMKRTALNRTMEDSAQATCIWLLKAIRWLIESKMNISLDSSNWHEESGYEGEESSRAAALRTIYNENGLTYLCLDLISIGIERDLYIEAMKMLVVLLLKSGGCKPIQQTIYTYLLDTDSVLFFELIKDVIENLKSWCVKECDSFPVNEIHQVYSVLPADMIVLNLLQLMCEGGFTANKNQLRDQVGNIKTVNILEALASFMGVLSRHENIINCYISSCVLQTILRLVQGPCKGNQEQFVLHTELLVSLNRIIRASRPASTAGSEVFNHYLDKLKEKLIDVLRGIIEGQLESSLVFERVSTTVDMSVLNMLIIPPDRDLDNASSSNVFQSRLNPSQAKYLAFVQSLGSLRGNIQGVTNSEIAENVSCVELVWNHEVHNIQFHVPEFINDLSMKSRLNVAESVMDSASQELKLVDFVHQCKIIFRESQHQQFLKKYGLTNLSHLKTQIARFMFINAIVMNVLILIYYGTIDHGVVMDAITNGHGEKHYDDDHHRMLAGGGEVTVETSLTAKLYLAPEADDVITALNIVQIVLASLTVAILFTVQVPVTFSTQVEKQGNFLLALLYTVVDPLPLWYVVYLFVAFIALLKSRLFLSILLLDWVVLDSTTRDLLLAVQYPARQLAATMIIILIMLNMFSGLIFVFYRHDIIGFNIYDMWETLKFSLSYGFRGEYGVSYEMTNTLGTRLVLDFMFYFIILAILRHIFFAIIVDTFGKLREIKFERESEANNCCFICGVERHDFDKLTTRGASNGFAHHRNITHNTLNYLYFILSIWHQSPKEDSGIDTYVRDCLERGDVSWFPIGVVTEASAEVAEEHSEGGAAGAKKAAGGGEKGHGGGHGGGHGKGKKNESHGGGRHVSIGGGSNDVVSSLQQLEMSEKMNGVQNQLAMVVKALSDQHHGHHHHHKQETIDQIFSALGSLNQTLTTVMSRLDKLENGDGAGGTSAAAVAAARASTASNLNPIHAQILEALLGRPDLPQDTPDQKKAVATVKEGEEESDSESSTSSSSSSSSSSMSTRTSSRATTPEGKKDSTAEGSPRSRKSSSAASTPATEGENKMQRQRSTSSPPQRSFTPVESDIIHEDDEESLEEGKEGSGKKASRSRTTSKDIDGQSRTSRSSSRKSLHKKKERHTINTAGDAQKLAQQQTTDDENDKREVIKEPTTPQRASSMISGGRPLSASGAHSASGRHSHRDSSNRPKTATGAGSSVFQIIRNKNRSSGRSSGISHKSSGSGRSRNRTISGESESSLNDLSRQLSEDLFESEAEENKKVKGLLPESTADESAAAAGDSPIAAAKQAAREFRSPKRIPELAIEQPVVESEPVIIPQYMIDEGVTPSRVPRPMSANMARPGRSPAAPSRSPERPRTAAVIRSEAAKLPLDPTPSPNPKAVMKGPPVYLINQNWTK